MRQIFIPETYQVPTSFESDRFRFEILGPQIAEMDYEAVMSSKTRLRSVFFEATERPRVDMSLDENRNDLARHESEFNSREAFAYTVLSPDRKKYIGCLYIDPPTVPEFDSEIYLWVRDDCLELDGHLYDTVKAWLDECWPFEKPAFPGREIPWEQWTPHPKIK